MADKVPPVPVPEELRGVNRQVLEDYVNARLRQLASVYGPILSPNAPAHAFDSAFSEAMSRLSSNSSSLDNLCVRLRHRCRFFGCPNKDCVLCKNNPHKRCRDEDNFDECYADCQILRSKCEADIFLHVMNSLTGQQQHVPGLELQLCVIDGESWSEAAPNVFKNVRRLLKSDEGDVLIGTTVSSCKPDAEGFIYLRLQEGQVRLPDVSITDKNDTFHLHGESCSTFRLMAQAVTRDLFGKAVPLPIPPAISGKFVVKTQRALNDYRKSEYPHYKDELTKLKFIGSITAQRLREIQTHLGYDVPFTSIETVEQLKHLMLYADQNRQVESKLLELLNMKGKHRQKWEYLREILTEKIVYDDMLHRAWYSDDSLSQGLLFTCKQGQVNMEKPVGVFRRVQQGTQAFLQVYTHMDPATAEVAKTWRVAAEQSWVLPGHGRWAIANERLEVMSSEPTGLTSSMAAGMALHGAMSGAVSPALSSHDPMDEAQDVYGRQSRVSSPHSRPDTPSDLRGAQQHSSGGTVPAGPGASRMMPVGVDMPQPRPLQVPQMPGRLSYGFHSVSPPSGPLQGHYRSGVVDPSMGVFQFMSAPTTQGSGVSPRSDIGDMYHRTHTAPTTHSTGRATGLQSRLSTGSQDNTERTRRYRRMSADAMSAPAAAAAAIAAQQATSHMHHHGGDPYGVHQQAQSYGETGLLKRPRSSAPSGLYSAEESAGLPETDMPFERARVHVYHSESHGRHLPRGRKSQENLSISFEPPNIPASVFDAHDLDIDNLLQNLEAPSFTQVKQEPAARAPEAPVLNLQQQGGLQAPPQPLSHLHQHSPATSQQQQQQQQSALGLHQRGWQTHGQQELAAGLQHTLKLGEPLSPQQVQQMQAQLSQQQAQLPQPHQPPQQPPQQHHPQAQPQPQQPPLHGSVVSGTGAERGPVLLGPGAAESDSFRSLTRLLHGSDSDTSFNRLNLSGTLVQSFPAAQHNDPSFDKALQDIIQGRSDMM